MRAVVYRHYGGPEVLEYTDVPDPKPSQNSVLVHVWAAALKPADHLRPKGKGPAVPEMMIPGYKEMAAFFVAGDSGDSQRAH
jgi:NADPH:quinone reductase-like Zn-dependent oxidoreductase